MREYASYDLTNQEYNQEVTQYSNNYRELNKFVMSHTHYKCKLDDTLANAIEASKEKQFIINDDYGETEIGTKQDGPTTNIIVSKKRSFEAAKQYTGKKIAVLNFANNHSIGGAPYSAGAQEECLCRTSTLYECLKKEKESFYEKHKRMYSEGRMNDWGNHDLIYTPDVVVFKTDESAPKMLPKEEWYKVDVITVAAPQLSYDVGLNIEPFDYGVCALSRLRRVFEIAKKQGVEVLILGAWGCGAFNNPPFAVATTFKILCEEYKFDTIEFAVYCNNDDPKNNYHIFKDVIIDSKKM